MQISEFIQTIHAGRIHISDHADEQAQSNHFTYEEIFFSVIQGEIIEEYPEDRPYPSCLIYGNTFRNEPIHSVWAYNEQTRWAVLVTVYRPDPDKWIGWRERRK